MAGIFCHIVSDCMLGTPKMSQRQGSQEQDFLRRKHLCAADCPRAPPVYSTIKRSVYPKLFKESQQSVFNANSRHLI